QEGSRPKKEPTKGKMGWVAGSNTSSGITSKRRPSPALTLPDADDRHVLAATIRAGTDVIVTFNLADFSAEMLKRYGIEGRHPDEIILRLLTEPGRRVPGGQDSSREVDHAP